MSSTWVIESPLDMHLHLRQGDMLKTIAPCSADIFAGAVVMPNTVPPVDSLDKVIAYRKEIAAAIRGATFEPYMTLFFRDYSEQELAEAKPYIIGVKLYPEGVTTNSDHGVKDINAHDGVFKAMENLGVPLLVHGETHGFVMEREREFLDVYKMLASAYPKLTIVMEHITTQDAVQLLDQYRNLHATVTLHHLLLTLDDMAGGLLDPHLFCKPLLKTPGDREALQKAVLSGHPKIMFGSDSAPHPVDRKECCGCAAGVFSAPASLAMLAGLFDEHGVPDKLQGFVSDHARAIYKINPPAKKLVLEKAAWQVPEIIGTVRPFMAGKTLPWRCRVVG